MRRGRGKQARRGQPIVLTDAEEAALKYRSERNHPSAKRAKAVLMAARGESNAAIARALHATPHSVARWLRWFREGRVDGLTPPVAPRARRLPPDEVEQVRRLTDVGVDAHGEPWTARSLARHVRISATSVLRIWKAHGICPRRDPEGLARKRRLDALARHLAKTGERIEAAAEDLGVPPAEVAKLRSRLMTALASPEPRGRGTVPGDARA